MIKPTPEGYTIGFCRHGGKRWGWKQSYADDSLPERPKERFGFRSRTQALRDLEEEIRIRDDLLQQQRSAS